MASMGLSHPMVYPNIEMQGPGQGLTLWAASVLVTMKALSNETGGSYSYWEAILPPGSGVVLHMHTKEEETWYVLEGEVYWRVAEKEFTGTPGSFMHLPRRLPHRFLNKSGKQAKMILTVAPGGFEMGFLETGIPVDYNNPGDPPGPHDSSYDPDHSDLFEKYGIITCNEDDYPLPGEGLPGADKGHHISRRALA